MSLYLRREMLRMTIMIIARNCWTVGADKRTHTGKEKKRTEK